MAESFELQLTVSLVSISNNQVVLSLGLNRYQLIPGL